MPVKAAGENGEASPLPSATPDQKPPKNVKAAPNPNAAGTNTGAAKGRVKTQAAASQATQTAGAAASPPVILPKVAVRLANHQTYVRLVFDWDTPTSYTLTEDNGIAHLAFSRPGKIDLTEIYKNLPKSIGVFESAMINGVLQAAFTFPKNVRLRDSMIGHLVVVDILSPPDVAAVHPPGQLLPPNPNESLAGALSPAYAPANVPPPGEVVNGEAVNTAKPDNATKDTGVGDVLRRGAESYNFNNEIPPVVNCAVTRDPVPSLPWRFNCSAPVGAALFQRGESLYVVFDHKINFDLSKAEVNSPAANAAANNGGKAGTKGDNQALPDNWTKLGKNDSSIGYPGKGGQMPGKLGFPTNNGGNNNFPSNNLVSPPDPNAPIISNNDAAGGLNGSEFEILVVANGSAVRIALPPLPPPSAKNRRANAGNAANMKWVGRIAKLNPSIDPERPHIAKNGLAGSVWVVGLALAEQTNPIIPDFPVENSLDAGLKGRNYVRIPLSDAQQVIPLRFSEYDRPLMVIPTKQAGRGVGHIRRFMQFSLLPSQQGVLVQLEADGVNIGIHQGAVVIGGEVPVLLSRQLPPPRSVYEFKRWQNLADKYDDVRQRLQRVAAQADSSERDAARFDLAQFFVTYDHAANAIGLLDLLQAKQDDAKQTPLPIAEQPPSLLALRGAALVLNGDAKHALRDLSDHRLDGVPQIGLWRGAALAQTEQWAAADAAFRAGGNVPPNDWPLSIRSELILRAADTAWHLGNKDRVKNLLADYPSGQSDLNLANRVNYLRAQLRLASGDLFDEKIAVGLLDDMIARGDAWARAHGTWLKIQINLKHDAISLEEATTSLEHLRYAWSGGELEYEILKQLGDLYFKMGKPREGLKSMREAATWFPNRPDHPSLRAHLIDRFVELYTDPDLAGVPTLAALAVYDENRDLTPRDARGDAMIQHLADRLVKVDLLDRAAELLSYQIRVRLSGVEKSRVGAKLAEIELLDGKADQALAALITSENAENPPELNFYRNRLRARALFKANRTKEALQILASSTDRDSDKLRAEIFVATQQWLAAAQIFARLVGRVDGADGRKMDEARQNYVVNLATVLVMAGDNASVQKLNADFAPIFPDGLQKQAFLMLTNGINTRSRADLTALMAKFADLEQFRASMEAFTNGSKPSEKPAANNVNDKNQKDQATAPNAANTELAKKP